MGRERVLKEGFYDKRGQTGKSRGISGAVFTEESAVFLHIDRRFAAAVGAAALQGGAVAEGGIHLHHSDLCDRHLFRRIYHRQETQEQKVSLGSFDGGAVFCGSGGHIPDRKPPAGDTHGLLCYHADPLRRRGNAGRHAELKTVAWKTVHGKRAEKIKKRIYNFRIYVIMS